MRTEEDEEGISGPGIWESCLQRSEQDGDRFLLPVNIAASRFLTDISTSLSVLSSVESEHNPCKGSNLSLQRTPNRRTGL